ncbi:hypothetical protein KPL71_016332 [Citrus sinensis]|uniref:Uncharacterized protein n=1 Tax=Citrus sinensis TaxID=2711 RepID=A0ACB8KS63_CITSI|nr:hypothetical protein KPL71_016332 [Citrus sinensis]
MADVEEVQNGAAPAKTAVPAASTANFTGMKPQLLVEAPKATDVVLFYKTAFGALEIGCSMETKRKAEQNVGTGCTLCLETEDIEAALAKAVSAGAVAKGELAEGNSERYGGRVGKVNDPYGFTWLICSPVKKCAEVEA